MGNYWFRQRIFGYGSTPNTWQGWLFTLALLAIIFGIIFGFDYLNVDLATRNWVKGIALIVIAIPAVALIYAKTEGGWRWRG
jgi:hypothetical protein